MFFSKFCTDFDGFWLDFEVLEREEWNFEGFSRDFIQNWCSFGVVLCVRSRRWEGASFRERGAKDYYMRYICDKVVKV